jgi:mono/diheme cytochrome c family protein
MQRHRKKRRAPAGTLLAGALLSLGTTAAPGRAADNAVTQGQQIFMESGCFACHGQMGYGGIGPQFREDPFLGFSDYVVGQILIGRSVMPPFAERLSDEQIAAVASYIRNSWGNNFGDVKPQEVAEVRKTLQAEQAQLGSSSVPRMAPPQVVHPAVNPPPKNEPPAAKQ